MYRLIKYNSLTVRDRLNSYESLTVQYRLNSYESLTVHIQDRLIHQLSRFGYLV